MIELEEDKYAGAKRELEEETGFGVKDLKYLGMTYPYHRRLPQQLFLFVGKVTEEIGHSRDRSEQGIKIHWKSENEIDELVRNNKITNAHTLAHWALYKNIISNK